MATKNKSREEFSIGKTTNKTKESRRDSIVRNKQTLPNYVSSSEPDIKPRTIVYLLMLVCNSTQEDLDTIFFLFDKAIEYQSRNGYELWPRFSRRWIEDEIAGKRHWKVILEGKIACVFSVMYNDPVIWLEKDKDPAVYLHRIAVHPEFKGKRMVRHIREWAMQHAKEKHKKYLRMDTWGNNESIRNYYIKCGFNYIGQQYLVKTEGMPEHYGGNVLSLFQNEV